MNYHLKSKPKHPERAKLISVAVLFLVLVISAFIFPNFIRTVTYDVSKPLWSASGVISDAFSNIKNFFVFKNTLINKNLALQDEVASLQLKVADYDILSKENDDLKAELGRSGKNARIISSVLSRPPFSPFDTLVIDVGTSGGVGIGDKVYLSDNMIVGTVANTTANTSLVALFSSGNNKQQATLSRTGASFELVGLGGSNFKLEVPKDTDIIWGDSFMYPGLSSALLGNVYYIDTNSQSSFKTIYLRLPINVFSSKYVFVE